MLMWKIVERLEALVLYIYIYIYIYIDYEDTYTNGIFNYLFG